MYILDKELAVIPMAQVPGNAVYLENDFHINLFSLQFFFSIQMHYHGERPINSIIFRGKKYFVKSEAKAILQR